MVSRTGYPLGWARGEDPVRRWRRTDPAPRQPRPRPVELQDRAAGTTVFRVTCDLPSGATRAGTGLLDRNDARGRVGRDPTEGVKTARIAEPPMP